MAPTRRLTAILAADVAGYSRLMGADEEGTHERLRAHLAELVYPKIEEYRGRVVKDTGDGLLAAFASVVDAVRCAVEMQRGMGDRNALVPADSRIEFRIGINLGDVIAEKHDIFGDGVNIAARLEALVEPGGICVSRVVRDQVRDRLDYSFEDLGHQSVKNIARQVRVYAWRLEAAADPPPSDVRDVPPIPQSPAAPRLSKAWMPNAESTPLDLAAFDDLDTLTPELVEAVQVDIARAAKESEKLDDAARQITILASKGAREAATSAARSLGGDALNVEVLAQVADEAIRTMQEVMQIEREVAPVTVSARPTSLRSGIA
jgi:class 3 adenylate cyclase